MKDNLYNSWHQLTCGCCATLCCAVLGPTCRLPSRACCLSPRRRLWRHSRRRNPSHPFLRFLFHLASAHCTPLIPLPLIALPIPIWLADPEGGYKKGNSMLGDMGDTCENFDAK